MSRTDSIANKTIIMKKPIYLDNSATTPVDPRVAAKIISYLTEKFGNPTNHLRSPCRLR